MGISIAGLVLSIRSLFRRDAVEREMDDELRFHLDQQTKKHVATGLTPLEAERRARIELGGLETVREDCRDARGTRLLEGLVQDAHYGLRLLRKSPGFTAIAILTLALGMGANTAIFSVVDSILLNPLPYRNPDELITMRPNDAPVNIVDIRREAHAFSEGGGVNLFPMDYTGGTEPLQITAALVDAGWLKTLGVAPMLGRIIAPEEDVLGGPRNIVVGHRFWQEFLGSDPHAIGRAVPLSGNTYTVIGVMPTGFDVPGRHADVFVSLSVAYPEAAPDRGVHFMKTVWRLKPGVTLAQAQADISAIDRRLSALYPDTERGRQSRLVSLKEWLTGDIRPALVILFGAVGFLLLIACANFAGLLLANAMARRREFVIRASLGAGRGRLIRQSLTESLVLALLGGAAGLVLAKWGTSFLVSLEPVEMERFHGVQMNSHLFLFVFSLSLVIGAMVGLVPALPAASADVAETLKEGSRHASLGRSSHLFRSALVTAEFALAMILLIGAGLLIKAFSRLSSVNPGFNPQNLMTMQLQLPATRYREIPRQNQFRRELLERLNVLPGLEAAMITDAPLAGNYVGHRFVIDGRPPVPPGAEPLVQTLSVMGGYFHVMQIPLRAGRDFTESDGEGQLLVAVVNEALVAKYFPHENPIGARIEWAQPEGGHRWMTIIGVVRDVKHTELNEDPDPAVYTPFAQNDEAWRRWMTLVIRSPGPSAGIIEEVKKVVRSMDRQMPVNKAQPMGEYLRDALAQQRFNMLLLGMFAALALILAAGGIYGMMAYRVGQRMHELGIRIALGAQRAELLWLAVGDGARLALLGIAIGLAGALGLTRVMTSLLFEVTPTDPATFALVTLLLAAAALAACYLPARRALKADPMNSLRYE